MKNLFFVGTAGSGKSTMVGAYRDWMDDAAVDSIIVNMDPGADTLPYEPDVDIREWISLDEVMQEYSLGPNGAQIVAADLMAVNIGKMMDVVSTYKTDYALIDTPGQLELFAFRESSEVTVRAFGRDDSMIVYLSDPSLCRTPNGFISAMTLGALVQFRLQLPMLNLLSKCDTLSEEDEQRMLDWYQSPTCCTGTCWIRIPCRRPSWAWSCSRPWRTWGSSGRSGRSPPRTVSAWRRSTPHPS